MANTDAPSGLRPYGKVLRIRAYDANTSTDIGIGDAVVLIDSGYVAAETTAAGGLSLGVAATPVDASASASSQKVWVYDHPEQAFVIQADSGTTPAQTNIGNTADLVCTTLDTTFFTSKQELDASDLGTDASSALKVVDILDSPDNSWGEHVKLVVQFDRHYYKTAGGV